MIITWNGYCFEFTHDGAHYLAICQRTGKPKTRFDRNVWHNANGSRITNRALLIALEQGVSDWQRQNAAHSFAPARGKHAGQLSPVSRIKGRITRRESRGKAGVE